MDEAERCHDIGYILHGRLIARGTADEIIGRSGLVTFSGTGPEIDRAARELAQAPGVLSASAFGSDVHVSSTDCAAIEAAIAPWRRKGYRWEEVPPSLEDVFIQLVGREDDERYAA
jgi:ABC-2 type transport system ATP-binding protein